MSRFSQVLNSRMTMAALIVLVPTALVFAWYSTGPKGKTPSRGFYYYEPSSGQTFVVEKFQLGPVAAPGDTGENKTGVLARVFSCGECSDAASRMVGYLESYDATAVARVFSGETSQLSEDHALLALGEVMPQAILVRSPGPQGQWEPQNSRAGQLIVEAGRGACPSGSPAAECRP